MFCKRYRRSRVRIRVRRHGCARSTLLLNAPPCDCIGIASLLELFDGDAAAVSLLLETARSSIDSDLARIEAAALAGNVAVVADAAHRLKGTSGSIGASRLLEASSSVERAARSGAFPDLAPMLRELGDAVRVVSAAVASYTSDTGSSRS